MKNKSTLIAIILLILAVALSLILSQKKEQPTINETSTSIVIDNGELQTVEQLCYQYKEPAEITATAEIDAVLYNTETIKVSINDGLVEGTHAIIPAEKDANRATFFGATQAGYINVIATANTAGESWQEQRVYKFDEDRLYVGYQPTYQARIKNENDIYMYQDIETLAYETDQFFLSRIDCDDIK